MELPAAKSPAVAATAAQAAPDRIHLALLKLPSWLVALVASAVYLTGGPTLILVNNQLLKNQGFPYPIALSAGGVIFTAVFSQLAIRLRLVGDRPIDRPGFFVGNALPIAVLSALTLALGNAAYVHLTVATCQILKTLTPALTLAVLYVLQVEIPSGREAACVVLITCGTAVATTGGGLALVPLGVTLQILANLAEAIRIVLSQRLVLNMSLLQVGYHVAPTQAACLLLAAATLELRDPTDRAAAAASIWAHSTSFFVACTLGYALQGATMLVVRYFGSVAVKLLGQARNAALVLSEVSRGNQKASAQQLLGYSISLGAFCSYVWLRQRPKIAAERAKTA